MAKRSKIPPTTSLMDGADPWRAPEIQDAIDRQSRKNAEAQTALSEKFDAYINRLTGVGDYLQDKTLGGSRYGLDFMVRYLTWFDIENRWRGTDVGARVVEKIPEEMTREGWDVIVQPSDGDETDEKEDAFPNQDPMMGGVAAPKAPPKVGPLPEVSDEGAEITEQMDGEMERLGALDAFLTAMQYERAYGGSAILIGADDGMKDLTKPLDEENVSEVRFLNVFQGGRDGEIIAWSYYNDPGQPNYGTPEIYMIRNLGVPLYQTSIPGQMGVSEKSNTVESIFWVHESRLLIFPGKSPSRRARTQMRGWGDSIFTRVDEVLEQYSQTWGGVAVLMTEFKLDVLGVEGNAQKLAGDKVSKGNPLLARARVIQQTKSVVRMLVIDKDKEQAQRLMANVSGISEVLEQFWLRLAAAVGMPLSLLTGQVKGGLGDAGNTDIRFFYDEIASTQNRVLTPLLKRLVKILFLSKKGPTSGQEPERWHVKMRPLYRLTALETATLRKTDAETDHLRIADGVLSPEEVAGSAYGGSEYSSERTVDIEGREAMAAQDEADKAEREKAMLAGGQGAPGTPVSGAGTSSLSEAVTIVGNVKPKTRAKSDGAIPKNHFAQDETEFAPEKHPRDSHGQFTFSDQEIADKLSEQMQQYDYSNFGLRLTEEQLKDGDVLGPSRVWDDGTPTSEYLEGTSTIGISQNASPKEILSAIKAFRSGGYPGEFLSLVGSDKNMGAGYDEREEILKDPVVLERYSLRPKG